MNTRKRVLSVQDISCLGQCSLTVALPVLSACGAECAVLPTAILSTHTGPEFQKPTFRDLTEDVPLIVNSWAEQGITFDAISIGYLGSRKQIGYVSELIDRLKKEETLIFLDPVMADNGKFYSGFDWHYAEAMKSLCQKSDILVPNLTESCFLLGRKVPESCDEAFYRETAARLSELGPKTVIITGLDCYPGQTANLIYDSRTGECKILGQTRLPGRFHGTGDLFASVTLGQMMQGKTLEQAVDKAGEVVCAAISATEPSHTYGVRFEAALGMLTK